MQMKTLCADSVFSLFIVGSFFVSSKLTQGQGVYYWHNLWLLDAEDTKWDDPYNLPQL